MLPLLRVLLPGCVLITTLGLAAGFTAPAGSRAQFARIDPPARGALIAQNEHPEWKQFLVLAAVRRSQELERLGELHDPQPAKSPVLPRTDGGNRLSGLPATRSDAEPDDNTGSVPEKAVNDIIPIDIGETSSTELPIGPPQTIPAIEKPQRLKLPDESQVKPAAAPRRAKARTRPPGKPKETAEPGLLTALFGNPEPPKPPAPAPKRRAAVR